MAQMETTRYELPSQGITLLGYVVRRMHKTGLLEQASRYLSAGQTALALEQVALYAAASSTSFGPAYYQPQFNRAGETISENDPETGATIVARLEATSPHYLISYTATLSNGDCFSGRESITGTTVGLRGLGMPAPSKFTFQSGAYTAELNGLITSELALSLFRQTRIRAYGWLDFQDNAGNRGRLTFERSGALVLSLNGAAPDKHSLTSLSWQAGTSSSQTAG